MKSILKYKNRIIIGAIILAVLAFTFWWEGNSPALHDRNMNETQVTENAKNQEENQTVEALTIENVPENKEDTDIRQDVNNEALTGTDNTPEVSSGVNEKAPEGQETNRVNNEYHKEPVTEEKPTPINPEDAEITDKALSCTLSVRCDTILNNIDCLLEEKVDIVPKDGVIFKEKEVTFYEGESVFNVLLREMKKNKIHLEFVKTPLYNSAYIEGIANLYEFDCGELSGWMYKVNGWFPNYGCSRYILKQGDRIEWVYTCDLGRDVGGSGEWQKDE